MNSPEVRERIATARKAGKFTDYSLRCEDQTFPVHKIVLCSQSEVFDAAVTNPAFKESGDVYEIAEASAASVQRMIDFLYTGKYDSCSPPDAVLGSRLEQLLVHCDMLNLADMYMIDHLQAAAASELHKTLKGMVSSGGVLEAATMMYARTKMLPHSHRKQILYIIREGLERFPAKKGDSFGLADVWSKAPELVKDLLETYLETPVLGRCHSCSVVPTEILQRRCMTCGKGGATSLSGKSDAAVLSYDPWKSGLLSDWKT